MTKLNDIVWSVISLIELSVRLKTFVQLEVLLVLEDDDVSLLHKSIRDRTDKCDVLYYDGLLTIRIYPT